MQPEVKIGMVANLYSRMMRFQKKGDVELGHTHEFDHLTLLASGKLKVTVEGQVSEFTAPHMIYIRKDKQHELVALEDETVAYCIHPLRLGGRIEDIVDPEMVPEGVELPFNSMCDIGLPNQTGAVMMCDHEGNVELDHDPTDSISNAPKDHPRSVPTESDGEISVSRF